LVIASAAGAPRHPAWYHNLVADPLVRENADADRVRAEVDRIAEDLTAHLRYEEEHLLPALSAPVSPPG
jgi:hypothetical protein